MAFVVCFAFDLVLPPAMAAFGTKRMTRHELPLPDPRDRAASNGLYLSDATRGATGPPESPDAREMTGPALDTRDRPRIWLLGGTGAVGRKVADFLPQQEVADIFTVSRGPAATGNLRHVQADLRRPGTPLHFRHGDRVVNLTEHTPPDIAAAAIRQGAVFLDSSASPGYVKALRRLAQETAGPGYLVDCVGTAPGLTNIMARHLAESTPGIRHIDIAVELGMGKHAGPAATEWFLRSLDTAYEVTLDGHRHTLRPGEMPRRFALRPGMRDRLALNFPFAEQSVLAEELSGITILSFFALDPPWVTSAAAALLRLRAGALLSRNAERLARAMLRLPAFGPETTRILVRGIGADGLEIGALRLATGDQSTATAALVAATALAAPTSTPAHGQSFTAADFLTLHQAVAILRAVSPGTQFEGTAVTMGTGVIIGACIFALTGQIAQLAGRGDELGCAGLFDALPQAEDRDHQCIRIVGLAARLSYMRLPWLRAFRDDTFPTVC